jgi:DNA-directed RNA polymerase subunit RPC12/RpoP
MSLEIRYVYICNICKQEAFLREWRGGPSRIAAKPTGWQENVEGEHVCPDCWTQNKELHPKGVVWAGK